MRLTVDRLLSKLTRLSKSSSRAVADFPEDQRGTYEFGYLVGSAQAYIFSQNSVERLKEDTTFAPTDVRPPTDYIYKDIEIRLSNTKISSFIQDLAKCAGTITCFHPQKNGFPVEKVSYWRGLFRIKFIRESDLTDFHNLGYTTNEIPRVDMGGRFTGDDF